MGTGKVLERKTIPFHIAPPKKGLCAVCAINHPAEFPHNQQSLYYQYFFYADHERWPTWADAIAHCSEEMKAHWKRELKANWSEPEGAPIAIPYSVQQ